MDGQPSPREMEVAEKIARLVQERGWNQEDFARIADLNRHTVREILKHGEGRRLRNATIGQCAKALGLQVNELYSVPLERLLPRMHGKVLSEEESGLRNLNERATSKELLDWLQQNPERSAQISIAEADELLGMEGLNGPIARWGVEHCVELLERRRRLCRRVAAIVQTEYLDLLEQFVGLLFEKVQPQQRPA
jgi:transcriptional regulator with XRE-family HTH domain